MHRLRLFLATRPFATLWLVACVLAVRMLVPAGYMPVATAGGVGLGLCPGTAPVVPVAHAAMAGMHHDRGEQREEAPAGAAMPCAFVGLGLAAIDVPAFAVAPVMLALGLPRLLPASPLRFVAAPVRWRPPLRAPPLG